MFLKESEAKFKYCPLLKTHDDKLKFCQASMCMMWRQAGDEHPQAGFCGLAGSPFVVMQASRKERRQDEQEG